MIVLDFALVLAFHGWIFDSSCSVGIYEFFFGEKYWSQTRIHVSS